MFSFVGSKNLIYVIRLAWHGKHFYPLCHLANPIMTRSFSSCHMDYGLFQELGGPWLGLSRFPVFPIFYLLERARSHFCTDEQVLVQPILFIQMV